MSNMFVESLKVGKIPRYLSTADRIEGVRLVVSGKERSPSGQPSFDATYVVFRRDTPEGFEIPPQWSGFVQVPLTVPIAIVLDGIEEKEATLYRRQFAELSIAAVEPIVIARFAGVKESADLAPALDIAQRVGSERNPVRIGVGPNGQPNAAAGM